MPKPREDPITATDLRSFVERDSDFAFEMQVLVQLRGLGFDCSHSGSYKDPVTDKIRQFDIRAISNRGLFTLALAVECKNLRQNLPLLLSTVPRTNTEAFHDLLVYNAASHFSYPSVRAVEGHRSAYKPSGMVGKKTDQVGREASGEYFSNDEATFDKLNRSSTVAKTWFETSL
jgi:hypothetical protein